MIHRFWPTLLISATLPLAAGAADQMRFPAGLGGDNDRMMTAREVRDAGLVSIVIERAPGTGTVAHELGLKVTRAWGDTEVVTVAEDQAEAVKSLISLRSRVTAVSIDQVMEAPEPERSEATLDTQSTEVSLNDPQYSHQTYWRSQESHKGASGIEEAYANSARHDRLKVVVIDGGFDDHPDLNWAGGISLAGDGRDFLSYDRDQCPSYHGQSVAAIIGSLTDNSIGMAGILEADLYAARVLACDDSGYLSDVTRGIRWAAGEDVGGDNQLESPADIINLSLGSEAGCPWTLQAAINSAREAGATVVASAGNAGTDASSYTPANCEGVITVGANTLAGDQTSFSNYGEHVDVSALGQEVRTQVPDGYWSLNGTSFSAPIVSGIVGLLRQDVPEAPESLIRDLVISSTTQLRNYSEPMGGVLNAPLLQANAAQLLDDDAPALQHPARTRELDDDAPHWEHLKADKVCDLQEFNAGDLSADDSELYSIFQVAEGEELTTGNGTLLKASEEKRFLMQGTDPEMIQGVQLCTDPDGGSCRNNQLIPLNMALAEPPGYCNTHER